ncbi:MAG: NADP-dependent oxidoreductase [Pseudomonadales bacterium]|jgi:NADPH-dependent curcumin reductase CurA|nr:NADP-dependent oxidoreductase [Pseudomonadales bacterium]MDG1306319.1 NADP-dependent oxidoreductase [Pseudomonadales bacterium]MDG1834483.1 NADP-dependent oxidoreductase [Pseudomonadales bacterium]
MVVSKEIHLVKRPEGMPVNSDFAMVEATLNAPADGEVLVRNIYMSVDPAMRPAMTNGQTKLDRAMEGSAIGQVAASNHPDFPEGSYVLHRAGFREYHLSDGKDLSVIVPEGESLTTHLHVLGMTGLTAYGGMLVTGELKENENVFVSAAAGAVGSVAVQIAKIKNCRTIGSCGSDEKVDYLTNELGLDGAFNYKTQSIARSLHELLPEGIDVYFENVGGAHLDAAMGQMRALGRVPVCGMISAYNTKGARSEGVTTLSNMIYNRVTMKGFVVYEFFDMRDQFLADMRQWIAEGKMKYQETIMQGVENAPNAMIGLLQGENSGKMLVQIGPETE